jgi:hypothetical protein
MAVAFSECNTESVMVPLQKMDDAALKSFGKGAAFLCSSDTRRKPSTLNDTLGLGPLVGGRPTPCGSRAPETTRDPPVSSPSKDSVIGGQRNHRLVFH